MGFCSVWPLPCGSRVEVVSARLNPSHGTVCVREVCNFLGSLSLQQKFEATDGLVIQLRLIWQTKGNTPSRHEGGPAQEMRREEEPHLPGFLLLYIRLLPLHLPCVHGAGREGCVFCLRASLWSADLLVLYSWAFPFCVFWPLPFWTPFPYSNYRTGQDCSRALLCARCCLDVRAAAASTQGKTSALGSLLSAAEGVTDSGKAQAGSGRRVRRETGRAR